MRREIDLAPAATRHEHELLDAAADAHALWQALVEVVHADLAIAKPGYDSWEGE
ncbi:hypothetical protein [Nocardia fluminea]|uniref:hypothetical protein n=1 Tax=Nocardia fluminea TaxID=134984 RepID=UPI003D0DCCBE